MDDLYGDMSMDPVEGAFLPEGSAVKDDPMQQEEEEGGRRGDEPPAAASTRSSRHVTRSRK